MMMGHFPYPGEKTQYSTTPEARLKHEPNTVRGVKGEKLLEDLMDQGKLEVEYEAASWLEVEKLKKERQDQDLLEHMGEFVPGFEVKKLLENLRGQDRLNQCDAAQGLEEEKQQEKLKYNVKDNYRGTMNRKESI